MAAKENSQKGNSFTFPIWAMLLMAGLGAVLSGASFEVIKVYPLPQSVEPYLNFGGGAIWGVIIGGVTGFVIGHLTDDSHFTK
ncbi:MAG: hypothetical protein SFY67_04690 [Candidatus Melainabacteria bacterium]|nr:hypothetical protein [Candidatus Melainabacteria bacterium]